MDPPDDTVSEAVIPYSGAWEGHWSDGSPSALVVRSIADAGASVLFVWKDDVYLLNVRVTSEGTLSQIQPGTQVLWSLSPDLETLGGTKWDGDRMNSIAMTRCMVPSAMKPAPTPTTTPRECEPTNQDSFVYLPARLQMLSPCVRATGLVVGTGLSDDGDGLINLLVDAQYEHLVDGLNVVRPGVLHLEIVCYTTVKNRPTIAALCASDPEPLRAALPKPGQRIWAEGRWVLDSQHGYWVELHPVYRWGPIE